MSHLLFLLAVIAGLVVLLACSSYPLQQAASSAEPDTTHQSTLTIYGQIDQNGRAGTFLYVSLTGGFIPGMIYFDTCPKAPIRCAFVGFMRGDERVDQVLGKGDNIVTDSEEIPRFKVIISLNGSYKDMRFDLEPLNGGYFTTGCYRKQPDSKDVLCPSVTS